MSAKVAKRARADGIRALIEAQAAMATHTSPLCGQHHRCAGDGKVGQFRCCDDLFCGLAETYAHQEWRTRLAPVTTERGRPRFLGPNGCTVAPHLRPGCTGYSCPGSDLIRSDAFTHIVGPRVAVGEAVSVEWDTEYLRLHDRVTRAALRAGKAP